LQPFQGIVNGTSQNWQHFQGRRISRMPKTTINESSTNPKGIHILDNFSKWQSRLNIKVYFCLEHILLDAFEGRAGAFRSSPVA